ncbi:MAG: AMP-binding protein [bacterium]
MNRLDEIINIRKESNEIAIIHKNKFISYKELFIYASNLSNIICENKTGVSPNIVIYLEKSIEYIISIFGILKSGATYIPIDYQIPLERLNYIIKNCNSSFIITNSNGVKKLRNQIYSNMKFIIIDDFKNDTQPELNNNPNLIYWYNKDKKDYFDNKNYNAEIAYIIYTSGSTGHPKGVMIKNESVVAFILSIIELVSYNSETRYLNVSPLHFDASVVDIFCTLYAGGTLILMDNFVLPNSLLATMQDQRITDTLLVSSILKLLTSRYSKLESFDLTHLKTIWYGAESCPVKVIKEIKKKLPNIRFIHGYGPTEATHTTTLYIFDEIDNN